MANNSCCAAQHRQNALYHLEQIVGGACIQDSVCGTLVQLLTELITRAADVYKCPFEHNSLPLKKMKVLEGYYNF